MAIPPFHGSRLRLSALAMGALLLGLLSNLRLGAEETGKPAQLSISGDGLFGDLELRHILMLLETSGKKPAFFSGPFIEDGVTILFSRLTDDGYLRPEVSAEMTLSDGSTMARDWTNAFAQTLPRPTRATRVHFVIRRGIRYYYRAVRFQGLQTVAAKDALAYFMEAGPLLHLKESRIYSPGRFRRSVDNVLEALEGQGFRDARAAPQVTMDDSSGAVDAVVQFVEGPKFLVRSVREEVFGPGAEPSGETNLTHPNRPFSAAWQQDFIQQVKTNYYHRGFPDVAVEVTEVGRQSQSNGVVVDLQARVETGAQVKLGAVQFFGDKKTKPWVLSKRANLTPGVLLDRVQVEQARYRLSQLGLFDSVGLRLAPPDQATRDALFDLKPGKQTEVSLLFGFGTYELLRGGIEIEQRDILGLADSSQLRLSQSFKTSSAYYVLTLPDLIAPDVNLFFDAEALRRQELSFLRQEYGGGVGAEKYLRDIAADVSVRYEYQLLTASQITIDPADGLASALDSAFIFDIKHDERDNPLYPHRGYKVFANLEVASQDLGGQVNYERYDIATSYHLPIGSGHWLHLGLEDGAAFTERGPQLDLPFDKRFFPGGENSIRGYTEGQAAPRDAAGNLVGAETFLLGTVELEQELTSRLSAVAFLDTLGEARRIQHFPFDEVLYSVGGGLGWRTLIGPVRLEYGYNLNRRPGDPAGTIQFSVGFPF